MRAIGIKPQHFFLYAARVDDLPGMLDVHAVKLLDGGSSWQYEFRVEHEGRLLAEGRAAVIHAAP